MKNSVLFLVIALLILTACATGVPKPGSKVDAIVAIRTTGVPRSSQYGNFHYQFVLTEETTGEEIRIKDPRFVDEIQFLEIRSGTWRLSSTFHARIVTGGNVIVSGGDARVQKVWSSETKPVHGEKVFRVESGSLLILDHTLACQGNWESVWEVNPPVLIEQLRGQVAGMKKVDRWNLVVQE